MGQFLQESIRDGSSVLYHDYTAGTLADLSGNGNNGTIVNGDGRFINGGVSFNKFGYVSVLDNITVRLINGTLVIVSPFKKQNANDRLIYKRTGSTYGYGWLVKDEDELYFFDGTAFRTITSRLIGHKSVGITFENGAIPKGYLGGLLVGDYSDTVSMVAAAGNVSIGNVDNGVGGNPNPFFKVAMFNRALSETEMSVLHGELMENIL